MRSSFTILPSPTSAPTNHPTKTADYKPRILPYILTLDPQRRLRGFCVDNKVVIAVRTVLVAIIPPISSYALPTSLPPSVVHTSRPTDSCPYGNTFCISCTRKRLRRAAAARGPLRHCGTQRSRTISGSTESGSRLVRSERVCSVWR